MSGELGYRALATNPKPGVSPTSKLRTVNFI